MDTNSFILWAPDIIKESNGIACGDMMSISAYRDNGRLYFSFNGNACSIASKVAGYIESSFSGMDEWIVKKELERLRRNQYLESELWIAECNKNSKNCVESPISLLYGIIGEISNEDVDDNNTILACDACVSTKPINWIPDKHIDKNITLKRINKDLARMDNPKEIEFQKLGLCVLSKQQQIEFKNKLSKVTADELTLIKKMRLAALYYNNSHKYGLDLDPRIVEMAMKQVMSLAIANEEIKRINEFIENRHLRIDEVKGGKTNKYYPNNLIRTHMDFDYLSSDFRDAFILISFLLNKRGFKMVIGGSVPFSIKDVLNINGKEVLTGHIHLEKILQDRYQVVVDINMGGFPLGRTGIIQFNDTEKIEIEDLICITTSHLFKHEHAFMKDINDLFYLLNSEELDCKKLVYKLNLYRLSDLFSIAYEYLKTNTNLNVELECKLTYQVSKKRMCSWPYSRKAHFYIKAKDMLNLNQRQYGLEIGIKETISQICGNAGEVNSKKYKVVCPKLNKRTYLYPVVIFNSYIDEFDKKCLVEIENGIMCYEGLLILPIGVFIIQNEESDEMSREVLNIKVNQLMKINNLSLINCNTQYVMEARKDIWLY